MYSEYLYTNSIFSFRILGDNQNLGKFAVLFIIVV